MCNYVKFETGWNFPPVLKIVTRWVDISHFVNVTKCARDQGSIFSTVFCPDYGVICSYSSRPFLTYVNKTSSEQITLLALVSARYNGL